jgi:PKD repeat protein
MRNPLCRGLMAAAAVLHLLFPAASLRSDEVDDVVITEIMYNPASGDRQEDFIEIHNRSTTRTYSLLDWRFSRGVDFTFPDIQLGPQEYLVICANKARIQQVYRIANVTGDWDPNTTLDNGGERIRLVNAGGITVDEVTYDDRAPWPILADGYGHSLERRRLDYPSDDPANWGASSAGTSWTRFTVTGIASSSTLYIYLTAAGTAYLDDVRIHPVGNPGDNRVQNGGFESLNTGWTRSGNHSGSSSSTEQARSGSRSMKIVATGAGSGSTTSISQTGLGLINGDQYTLELWVLFTQPGQSLIARLSGTGGLGEPLFLEASGGGATPGRQNSLFTTDLPPFVYPIEHSPATPTSASAVTLLATVRDDVAVASVTAFYDSGAGFQMVPMLDNGLNGDGAAGDGIFGARIGSFATGTIVRYWVEATDNLGQVGSYPFFGNPTPTLGFYIEPPGINPGFQARANSNPAVASPKPPVYHFILDPVHLDANGHLANNLTTYRRGIFIFNGEVFDNVRIRHRGQSSLGVSKKHWKVNFNKDHRFLTPFDGHPEVDNFNLQSSYGDKTFLREWLSYKAWMDIGRPGLEMWHVRLYLNGAYRGLYVHLENPDEDWMDRTGLDDEGWLWKSYSQAQSGSTGGFELDADAGRPAEANAALSSFLSQINSLTGDNLVNFINANMDVGSFTDFLVIHQLISNADHPAKNYLVYADEDMPAGTWTYYGWDMDLTHGRNFECGGGGVYNDTIRHDMFGDPLFLFGTSARPKCDGPWNGVINAFLFRTTAFREQYYARLGELLDQLYHPDVIIPVIDSMAAPLASEVNLDWNRNSPYGNRATHQFHVNQLKSWAQNRYNYIATNLATISSPDISNLSCLRDGENASLSWTNHATYTQIRIYRNNQLLRTLGGNATSATVALDLDSTVNSFRVASIAGGLERPGLSCSIILATGGFAKVIDENFNSPVPASELSVNCSAAQRNGRLELTEPVGGQAGSAFFRTRFPNGGFIADFDLRFDEPSAQGADGIVFILNTGNDTTVCGAAGGAMGYFTADGGTPAIPGYAIVFDTWQNAGEISHNWVGFIDSAAGGTPRIARDVPEEFNGNGAFHARVIADNGTFTLLLSNPGINMAEREIFTYTVPGFLERNTYFGFSAGTGGAVARHSVDNFCLQISTGSGPPSAAFIASPVNGTAPLTVSFTNQSAGDVTTYLWEFGDGRSSTLPNPSHTYLDGGTYTVSLTASGPGGTDQMIRQDYITVGNPIQVTAEFIGSPLIGTRPHTVTFTNQSTNAASYSWDFGDGGSSTAVSPTYVYASAGEYTVTLTAIGPGGARDTRARINYVQVDDELAANFNAFPTGGPAPLVVQFVDASRGSTIGSWSWDFGDGATSTESNPQHSYTRDGVYTVRLQVSGFAEISTRTRTDFIRVGDVASEPVFLRGDANGDGRVDISDAIAILNSLFLGTFHIDCQDAADVDDNGRLELTDTIRILNFLFLSGPPPEPPHPLPGVDPTPDSLPPCER